MLRKIEKEEKTRKNEKKQMASLREQKIFDHLHLNATECKSRLRRITQSFRINMFHLFS